ncbi:hypothetical protein BH11ACT4_BH11ACT4_25520 [soil metagenome]
MNRSLALFPLLVVLALAGCAAVGQAATPTPAATAGAGTTCADDTGVSVVVDFGVLAAPSIDACVDAGPAADALKAAGISTEGTVAYGDQVVCRVDDRPGPNETVTVAGQAPFVEACQSMPAATAYWALWVKNSRSGEWEYAQEGLGTLQVKDGQSLGLVYTAGTDSTPPSS